MTLRGEERAVGQAERVVRDLIAMQGSRGTLSRDEIRSALRLAGREPEADIKAVLADGVSVPSRRKFISPKTANQKRYLDAVRSHDMVIAIGPAGTGKSYLAVAMAVSALMKREVTRIVLTRPAVEAGERLGFLPGDLFEKVHPYLRPLYDALYDMLEAEKVQALSERGAIEIAPLAYMRGRTLNDAFIILDEAQNTTSEQMKMFLTRLGFNSKMVITGDVTQVDLPASRPSGLIEIQTVLRGIDGIRFVYFDDRDVVRHDLVSVIVRAYDARPGRSRRRAAARRARAAPRGPLMVSVRSLHPDAHRMAARVRRLAARALAALGRGNVDLHVTLADDATIRRLHGRYLGDRHATDVLAFDLQGPGPSRLLGEVIGPVDTARRQARRVRRAPVARAGPARRPRGPPPRGYDDGSPAEARAMHERAREILSARGRGPAIPDRLWHGLLPA